VGASALTAADASFLCGDVNDGPVNQGLPYPSPPELYEPYLGSAAQYVELGERQNGSIPRVVVQRNVSAEAQFRSLACRSMSKINNWNRGCKVTQKSTRNWVGTEIKGKMVSASGDRFLLDVLRERLRDTDRPHRVFRERDLREAFLAGLAFHFCVRYSAGDAKRESFAVTVIEDACRSIDVNGSMVETCRRLAVLGIHASSATP
jgi:isochorismatase family protein